MAWDFGDRPKRFRRIALEREALNAEWDIPEGRIGGLVRQQRLRGLTATNRGRGLFSLLVLVILLGLAFYLGLPFWEQFVDSRKATLERQIAFIDERLGQLDRDRDSLVTPESGLVAFLRGIPLPVRAPDEEALNPPVALGNAILVTSRRGRILRSTDGGTSFGTVLDPTGEGFNPPVAIGDTIFVTGYWGTILRSTDGGASFEMVKRRNGETLNPPMARGDAIFVTGEWGSILRSTDGGASFERVLNRPEEGLNRPAALGQAIFITGRHGTILRSFDDGISFETVRAPDGQESYPPVALKGMIFVTGEHGSILRSTNGGASFDVVYANHEEGLYPPVALGDVILVTGWLGTILRSTDGGASFAVVFEHDGEVLNRPVAVGEAVFITGQDGTILRSTDGGASFQTVRNPDGEALNPPMALGDTIFLTGGRGTVLRSADAGTSFALVRNPDGEGLNTPIALGGAILVTGSRGTILRSSDDWAVMAGAMELEPSVAGDERLARFIAEDISSAVRALSSVSVAADQVEEIATLRAGLLEVRAETEARMSRLDELPFALLAQEDLRLGFSAYMEVCRSVESADDPASLTETCLTGWQAEQQAEDANWWQTLARQVPPGILLLFLLATLGGLYRYNMRMAGFHHSRADLLELISMGREADAKFTKEELAQAVQLADSLAADKVEFGKGNTPSDQAVELAKAISSPRGGG
ncbi:MAG: hypothetical protein AAGK37_09310 [Pseudomonadota bacterium]